MNTMVELRKALGVPLSAPDMGELLRGHNLPQFSRLLAGRQTMRVLSSATAVPEDAKGGVMLLGNFDGFHRGHRALLASAIRESKSCGGLPVGAMSVEPHPKQFFAPNSRPFRLTTPSTKQEMFHRLGLDFLYSPHFDSAFAGLEPEQFIEQVLVSGFAVSRIVVGRGFRFGRQRRGDVDMLHRFAERCGFAVTAVDELQHDGVTCSSTLVRNRISAGDIDGANALLGCPWSVEFSALSGSLLTTGESPIDWPTQVLMPAFGEYEIAMRGTGNSHILSIGRLTVTPSATRLEVHSPERLTAAPCFVDLLRRIGT